MEHLSYSGYKEYFIQRRGWFFWQDLGDYGDYFGTGRFAFKSVEEAQAFIESGRKSPYEPTITVVQYVN